MYLYELLFRTANTRAGQVYRVCQYSAAIPSHADSCICYMCLPRPSTTDHSMLPAPGVWQGMDGS